jgi:hypothetical protein
MENFGTDSASISQPRTSFDHVARAWHHGAYILDYLSGKVTSTYEHNSEMVNIDTLVGQLELQFHSPGLYLDLTVSDLMRHKNWHVVRVILPGALPRESDSTLPHLGAERLNRLMAFYGGSVLNTSPHPFG